MEASSALVVEVGTTVVAEMAVEVASSAAVAKNCNLAVAGSPAEAEMVVVVGTGYLVVMAVASLHNLDSWVVVA